MSTISTFMEYPDDSQRSVSWGFLYALLISLLAHGLLTLFVMDKGAPRVHSPVKIAPAQALRFRLLPRPAPVPQQIEDSKNNEDSQVVSESSPQATPVSTSKSGAVDDSRQPAPQVPRVVSDLDLSLPKLDQPISETPSSAQSATVFDQRLAGTLEAYRIRASTRSPPTPIAENSVTSGSDVGGRWQSFVQIGKLCFEVIAADPLDSLSTDQWFPRKCE